MTVLPLEQRAPIAAELHRRRADLATRVIDAFLERHPDWEQRYGAAARIRGEEDAGFHLDFLAAGIAAGPTSTYAGYARWAAQTLAARGIEPRFLAESLRDLGQLAAADLPEAAPEITAQTTAALAVLAKLDTPWPAAPLAERSDAATLFRDATLTGRRDTALGIAREEVRRSGLLATYCDVLAESQRDVGQRWQRNLITVADEHRATAVTQYVVAALYPEVAAQEPWRGTGLVTGVAGERHQLGPNIVADGLQSDGWDIAFLGTDLPHPAIQSTIESRPWRFVGISATLPANVPAVIDLVERIRRGPAPSVTILAGGPALSAAPELCQELQIGPPLSDVRHAVLTARELD